MNSFNQMLKNGYTKCRLQFLTSKSPASKGERIVAFLIFTIFATAFSNFQLVTAWFHHLDAAFMMEVLSSIRETGVPTTYLGPSFIDAVGTFSFNAETLCKADLIPSGRGLSVLDSHSYFILYPLAALTWLFPPHAILAVANGLGFVAIIYILYWILRRQGVSTIGAVAFCLLVMAHPAWSQASLGDFYADRFFMLLGLLYVALLYDALIRQGKLGRGYLLLVLAVGLLAASTTERGAIMIAMFTIATLVLYRKSIADKKLKIVLAIFSAGLFLGVVVYVKLVHVHHEGTGSLSALIQGIPRFLDQIQVPEYAAKVKEYLVINVLLFGMFSIFNWRLALIAFAVLLPNLLTTIGGAEKNGWATHYHSMYFPFLVFSTALGVGRLWNLLNAAKYRLALVFVLLGLIPAISGYSESYGARHGAMTRMIGFYIKGEDSYERNLSSQLHQVYEAVPEGVKVATSEGFVPTLYRNRTIYYYPVGIDLADYVVLTRVVRPDGSHYFAGAVSYIGESQEADECLTKRLRENGFNVDSPDLLVGDMAVLARKNK